MPDYLRESRSRLWPVAAVLLIAAALTFAGLVALRAFRLARANDRLFSGRASDAESQAAAGDQQPTAGQHDDEARPDRGICRAVGAGADDTNPGYAPAADRSADGGR